MYIPSTSTERDELLREAGLPSADALFDCIPEAARLTESLDLPPALTEQELLRELDELFAQSAKPKTPCFLGAGVYDHIIPAVVPALLSRSEFVTAYTPYQPEISQGTLTAIFQFQTMMTRLTGLDVGNASQYDAATAAAEACLMACGATRRSKVIVSRAVHPEIRQVLHTYLRFNGVTLIETDFDNHGHSLSALAPDTGTACVMVQSPNFFGVVEPMAEIAQKTKAAGAVPIAVCDPLSLGLLPAPGELGFDIAVGECQPLGLPASFGGPYAGYLTARTSFLRRMPGRIAGETTDRHGNRCFVLTMQAREQHIRREKATSNICSNQALCALAVTIFLSALGPQCLREMCELCAQKAAYLRSLLTEKGHTPLFDAQYFREFAVSGQIEGGYDLRRDYPELNGTLLAVTEKRTRAEIDAFAGGVR